MHTIEKCCLVDIDNPELSFCHVGVINRELNCWTSYEFADYPIRTDSYTLEVLSYFITDGDVNVGDVLEYAMVIECEGDTPEFFWGDDIPSGSFSVDSHRLEVTLKSTTER